MVRKDFRPAPVPVKVAPVATPVVTTPVKDTVTSDGRRRTAFGNAPIIVNTEVKTPAVEVKTPAVEVKAPDPVVNSTKKYVLALKGPALQLAILSGEPISVVEV